MLYDGREVKTVYVSGVSTRPEYRRQDIGNNLMRQAHFRRILQGNSVCFSYSCRRWLYEWYEKCGYARVMTCTPPPADAMVTPFEEFDRIQRAKRCVLLHDEEGYEVIREDIRLAGDEYRPQAKKHSGHAARDKRQEGSGTICRTES